MSVRAIAVALVVTAMMASTGRADAIDDALPRRELAGHVFYPSLIVNDPFVSTFVSLYSGAGYEWIRGPNFDVLGHLVGTQSYRAGAMAQGASFQLGLTDFLAIRIDGNGGIDGGTNARSALVVGLIAPLTAGAGVTASWKLHPKIRFGLTGDFVYTRSTLVQPLQAIASSIAAGEVQGASVSERLNGYSVLPGAAVAVAPIDAIGLLFSAQYSWTRVTDGDTTDRQAVNLGACLQLDLLPFAGVPLGFLASYRATIPFESDVRFGNTVEGGLFYTGRRDLDLGIDVQGKWLDLRPDHIFRLDSTEAVAVIEMRYYWN